ncbi:hypothetical protein [Paraglaciecola sp. 25GB23A]|uniref:hypothetical protein n=1 Tax=Paraglaciecola sp. 25GB23A TaxID=3156068 RepID=UPI0032AFF519
MKLGIVIPLKSKQISRDWKITSDTLQQSLESLKNQTLQNFEVMVVGHECPTFLQTSFGENIHFTAVDFAVPNRSAADFSHQKLIQDKNMKIVTGLKALQNNNISYWYQLDSDDVLRSDFIEKIAVVEGQSGAVIEGGYLIYSEQKRYIETKQMSQYCGSTSIIANDYMTIPPNVSPDSIKTVPWARYSHRNIKQFFSKELKQPVTLINDNILGYVLGSGDNISDRWRDSPIKALKAYLKPYIKGSKITKQFSKEFALK